MICAIHQPEYLPCLTLIGKIAQADVLVLLDDVQFKRDSLQQRAWIANEHGKGRWLTIPFVHKHPQRICDVRAADSEWGPKHEDIVRQFYRRAPHLDRVNGLLSYVWRASDARVGRAAAETVDVLLNAFDATPRRAILSSELVIETDDKSRRVAEICRQVGADTYLCGKSGTEYLDHAPFEELGVDIVVNRYEPPGAYRGTETPQETNRISGLDAVLWHDDPSSLVPHGLIR